MTYNLKVYPSNNPLFPFETGIDIRNMPINYKEFSHSEYSIAIIEYPNLRNLKQ